MPAPDQQPPSKPATSRTESAGGGNSGQKPTAQVPPQTVGEMQGMARAFLERKGLTEARREADLLVAHALGLKRLEMLLQLDRPLAPTEVDKARDLLVRRGRREPVAYITGTREFYGRPFLVGPGCLIPRPETEGIVDLVKDVRKEWTAAQPPTIVDLGTGSGCLAVTLALEWPDAKVVGLDISGEALEWARRNGTQHKVSVDWRLGDGFELARAGGPVDLFVSNPPYVEPREAEGLDSEVLDYEPRGALFAPEGDPDYFVRTLLEGWSDFVREDGRALFELGHGQGTRVQALVESQGMRGTLFKDLARIDRILMVQAS